MVEIMEDARRASTVYVLPNMNQANINNASRHADSEPGIRSGSAISGMAN